MTATSTGPETPILKVAGLTIRLPNGSDRQHAVRSAELELFPGEIVCIVGESGSGKSVLASALMGDVAKGLSIESGQILLGPTNIGALQERDLGRIRGKEIAMIFQEPRQALNPAIRIGRQIEELFKLHTALGRTERKARTRALLVAMQLNDHDRILNAYPHELSGGQCQRVVIAMALALDPKVLVADEATTALDVTTQAKILRLIREQSQRRGNAVLFITHDFAVVADIADRIVVMHQGHIVETGVAAQVLNDPQHAYTQHLLTAVPSLSPRPRAPLPPSDPVLEIKDLTHHYGATEALKSINLSLQKGEIVSIVGESGSGKSTLARAATRLISPTAGSVAIAGTPFLALKGKELRHKRRMIQMIFQDPAGSLNPRRSVGSMIARAARLSGAAGDEAKQRAKDLLRLVGLPETAYHRRPDAFSGGQRQRVGIARALAMQPDVLIADESVSALDVSVQAQVLDLLKSLQKQFNLGILFITHDLRVAAQISDRIAVMHRGRIIETGAALKILEQPREEYTRSLIQAAPGRGRI